MAKVNSSLKEIADLINAAKNILVVSHYNPDADAYGSSCALTIALSQICKKVYLLNETATSDKYDFIPSIDKVINNFPEEKFDLIITCDCGSLERVGDTIKDKIGSFDNKINLDHHISNSYFAKLNYVDAEACSTAEVVYDLLNELKVKLTPEIATALFAGISGDTGSFKYSSTTAKTFRIAEQLVSAGAKPDYIAKQLYSKNKLTTVKLHSAALNEMNIHFGGKVSEVVVTDSTLKKFDSNAEDTEALVEKARDISGVLISVMIREDQDVWKVSLRSADEKYNVSDVAASFGGGGHKMAAAFRWRKDLETLRKELLNKLSELFK